MEHPVTLTVTHRVSSGIWQWTILKIGLHLLKLWSKVKCIGFFSDTQSVCCINSFTDFQSLTYMLLNVYIT